MTPTTPLTHLAVDALGHAFGRRVLFRNLSFRIEGGSVLAVRGRNGSGKSTLLQILAGVVAPRAGTVALVENGHAVAAADHPFAVGLVAPYLHVYDGLTARENLAFVLRARGAKAEAERVADALAFVGLAGREDDRVGAFSSGMKQRVKYAAAYLGAPPLLLLDEPSANLDEAGKALVGRMRAWQTARGGVLVVATNEAADVEPGDAVVTL